MEQIKLKRGRLRKRTGPKPKLEPEAAVSDTSVKSTDPPTSKAPYRVRCEGQGTPIQVRQHR